MVTVTRLTLHSLFLASLLLVSHCKQAKWCKNAIEKVESCLSRGYQFRILENCPVRGTKMGLSCGITNNCRTYEKAVVKWCEYTCESSKVLRDGDVGNKTLYIITPTYTRPTQLAELTIMSRALEDVPNVEWIVLEQRRKSSHVSQFLSKVTPPPLHTDGGGRVAGGNL